MDAVIVAGGIPQPNEPLYAYSNGGSKALIDIAGKPMIQWVLDALGDAKTVDRVVIVGLTDKTGLKCRKPLAFLSNQGKLLENLKAGTAKVLELHPKAKHVLFVSSDIPAISGQMVDWVVNTCLQSQDDLYYNVIRRESMESLFPTSRRTYTRLKDMQICGGDMNIARAEIVSENSEFWSNVLDARKNPAAQAALIGGDIILKYVFGRLTIDDVIHRVADKLGIKGRAIVCPFPEVGMDVDKPHQLEIMRAYLGRKPRGATSAARRAGNKSKRTAPKRPAARKAARRTTAKAAPRRARRAVSRSGSRPRKR